MDDVEAFVSVANVLRERGAYKIYVMATHGVLSAEAPRLIEDSPIHEVRSDEVWPTGSYTAWPTGSYEHVANWLISCLVKWLT